MFTIAAAPRQSADMRGGRLQAQTVDLRSQPNSGCNSWLELVLLTLMHVCCAPDRQRDCRVTSPKSSRELASPEVTHHLEIGPPGARSALQHVMFRPHVAKHELPAKLNAHDKDRTLLAAARMLLDGCLAHNVSIWSDDCLRRVLVWPSPMQMQQKTILLLRDPRVTTMMWFRSTHKSLSRDASSSLLTAAALNAAALSLRYVAHARFTTETLTLYHEQLLADPSRWFTTVAEYLGLPTPTVAELRRVLTRANTSGALEAEAAWRGDWSGRHEQSATTENATSTVGERPPQASSSQAYILYLLELSATKEHAARGAMGELEDGMRSQLDQAVCSALASPMNSQWVRCAAVLTPGGGNATRTFIHRVVS